MKYCWLNLETGEFSNTWGDEEMKTEGVREVIESHPRKSHCKLIKFECMTDDKFEFTNHIKLR